jgi:hypothetical protein
MFRFSCTVNLLFDPPDALGLDASLHVLSFSPRLLFLSCNKSPPILFRLSRSLSSRRAKLCGEDGFEAFGEVGREWDGEDEEDSLPPSDDFNRTLGFTSLQGQRLN